ncbi:unnamed protein product [Boreogadus saida]
MARLYLMIRMSNFLVERPSFPSSRRVAAHSFTTFCTPEETQRAEGAMERVGGRLGMRGIWEIFTPPSIMKPLFQAKLLIQQSYLIIAELLIRQSYYVIAELLIQQSFCVIAELLIQQSCVTAELLIQQSFCVIEKLLTQQSYCIIAELLIQQSYCVIAELLIQQSYCVIAELLIQQSYCVIAELLIQQSYYVIAELLGETAPNLSITEGQRRSYHLFMVLLRECSTKENTFLSG